MRTRPSTAQDQTTNPAPPKRGISIALATYNGARYLPEFLDSLVEQTRQDFELVVSDDGSTDNTLAIVASYADRLAIKILPERPPAGIARNFEHALSGCESDFVALADQDDVWVPEKLERLADALRQREGEVGRRVPLLVFSDLVVVGEDLVPIHPSFYGLTLKSSAAMSFRDYVLDNHIPGCAMLVNRPLLDIALPFPNISIHDWWLALLAAAVGDISHVPQPLVLYRQHQANSIGIGSSGENIGKKYLGLISQPSTFFRRRMGLYSRRAVDIHRNLRAVEGTLADDTRAQGAVALVRSFRSRNPLTVAATLFKARAGVRMADRCVLIWMLTRRVREADAAASVAAMCEGRGPSPPSR